MKAKLISCFALVLLQAGPVSAASGMFPKMPPATNVFVVNIHKDSRAAKRTAWALQGLINQSSAEVYVISSWIEQIEQLKFCGKPFEWLTPLPGENAGLRTLFQKYQGHVKKMFLYDPRKDWTWYLAQMAGAQQDGIPVTESLEHDLTSEFGWKGKVEDFRNRWPNRIAAYNWALVHLMPQCSKQVVFELQMDKRLCDYVVASKGFDFWLNPKNPEERAETEKIFSTKGYGLGTSLMGYHWDKANRIANPYGIGYVVSDYYGNGSFWSSFPNKTYTQPPGHAVKAEPGRVYASIMWSDGDNIQFDQNSLFDLWHNRDHGTVPVATALSPTLQELNSPLLDWYYSKMTTNDELIAGAVGLQFIVIPYFKDDLFQAWCKLTRDWCRDAGFHSVRTWLPSKPSLKFDTYAKTCGFVGILGEGTWIQPGFPPKVGVIRIVRPAGLFGKFTAIKPDARAPVFVCFVLTVEKFVRESKGLEYSTIKQQIDRVEAAYPGRYVFLLPKDQFATIRAYYKAYYPSTN